MLMKKYLTILLLIFFAREAHSQICKTVKHGMTPEDVIKIAGQPDSVVFIGVDKASADSLSMWHYGTQIAWFIGKKVDRVVVDEKKESELSKRVADGYLSPEDFEKQLEELNQNSCK